MIKIPLVIANLIVPVTSFYLFSVLNHHGPAGDEFVAQVLYVLGIVVVVLNFIFVFKKRDGGSKKASGLNVIFILLVFVHLAINSIMLYLVMGLMQL